MTASVFDELRNESVDSMHASEMLHLNEVSGSTDDLGCWRPAH